MSLSDAPDRIQPTNQRLALPGGRAACLRRPRALVDEFHGKTAQALSQLFVFGLHAFQRDTTAAVKFVIELPPCPGGSNVARRLTTSVHPATIANCAGPGRRCALQFSE